LCIIVESRLGVEIDEATYKKYELDRPDLKEGQTFFIPLTTWKNTYKNHWFYEFPIEKAYFKAYLSVCKSKNDKWNLEYDAFDTDGDDHISLAFIKNNCHETIPDDGIVVSKELYEYVELGIGAESDRKLHMDEKDTVNYDDA
jgi:hypothetical protein